MGVQLNSSKFKSNDLTRMMPVSSEPFKTLQIGQKFKQPPSVPCCGIVHAGRFGWPRTIFARLFSAYSCKRSNHSQTHGYEACRVDAVGESSRPECRTDGTKEIKSMPPPQPTDEVRRFFFGSFFFASLSHIRPHGLQTHTRSPLGVVCMCVAINTASPNPVTPRTMPRTN